MSSRGLAAGRAPRQHRHRHRHWHRHFGADRALQFRIPLFRKFCPMSRFAILLPMIALAACQPSGPSNTVVADDTAVSNDMAMGNDTGNEMRMTGDQDRDFATMMTAHHNSAIAMARTELDKGQNPEMRALAEKIIVDQQREIKQMEAYLAKP
ncbi:MAG: DUF305 domain-containing protein [Sphingomonas bacterium]|nr:DUF305 domain-containing protein [Sphingomonas bacterium]